MRSVMRLDSHTFSTKWHTYQRKLKTLKMPCERVRATESQMRLMVGQNVPNSRWTTPSRHVCDRLNWFASVSLLQQGCVISFVRLVGRTSGEWSQGSLQRQLSLLDFTSGHTPVDVSVMRMKSGHHERTVIAADAGMQMHRTTRRLSEKQQAK
nr:MAG: hypothetical protein [Chemarfal virus 139]